MTLLRRFILPGIILLSLYQCDRPSVPSEKDSVPESSDTSDAGPTKNDGINTRPDVPTGVKDTDPKRERQTNPDRRAERSRTPDRALQPMEQFAEKVPEPTQRADTPSTFKCKKPLTQWEQKMLREHNRWRSSVQPPAKGMYRVYWDTNIAANAAKWIASCDPKWPHSPSKARSNIGGYKVLGENLSYCAGSACRKDPQITDNSGNAISQGWWNEHKDYSWKDDTSSGVTSHYTQMVSSNVYAIGCATKKCPAPGPGGWKGSWWWTICQYGPRGQAYWKGTKPYEAGKGGLVTPPNSVFAKHPGLCIP